MRGVSTARAARAVAALLAMGILAAGRAGAAERRVHVQGRVTDPEGRGVAALNVRLFKTRRGITLQKFSSGGQVAEAVRATTDDGGFFEIDVPRDRAFDDYYLRFYDLSAFDLAQYEIPADRDITRELRRGETLRIDVRLTRRPEWPEVLRRLEAAGSETPKGRVLRSMGLPEREGEGIGPDGPREEWWYHSRGIVYFFRDGQPSGYRTFEPVVPPPDGGR